MKQFWPDLVDVDPLVLLACTALYLNVDSSPCTYCQFQLPIRELFSLRSLRTSDLPQFSSGNQIPVAPRWGFTTHTASVSQSEGTRTSCGAPVFLPADQLHTEFVPPGISTRYLPYEDRRDKAAPIRFEID